MKAPGDRSGVADEAGKLCVLAGIMGYIDVSTVYLDTAMVQDVNEFGKRLREDDDGDRPSSKGLSVGGAGLHRFATASSQGADVRALEDRYQKFIQSSLALRGAIDFGDLFQKRSSSGVYAKQRERCVNEFHGALAVVLADTPSLDADQQRIMVEMACNTEKVAEAGKSVNMAFKHVDTLKEAPRSILLLNGIRFFQNIQPDTRVKLFENLRYAIGRGYCGQAHLDALKAAELGQPPAVGKPLSNLVQGLEMIARGQFFGQSSAPNRSSQGMKLDDLPPELLQKVLLQAIEPGLRKDTLQGLDEVIPTIDAIGRTNKYLRENANELKLLEFSEDSKVALSSASKRYRTLLGASDNLHELSEGESLDVDDQRFQRARRRLISIATKVIPVIKFLKGDEQSTVVSTFSQTGIGGALHLTVAASERADDFLPKPRSEMFANLIHLLPDIVHGRWLPVAANQLAKAHLAGHLDRRHENAMNIASLYDPGFAQTFLDSQAALKSSLATVEPPALPLIPRDSGAEQVVVKVDQARQSLLQKVDDRAFSR